MNEIVTAFDEVAIGEVNETYERFLFNNRSQRDNETFESFLSSIRELSKTSGYCEKCVDSLLRDRIVLGIKEVTTQELLLRERTLTLSSAIDICKAAENASTKSKVFQGDDSKASETVNHLRYPQKPLKKVS